MTDCQIIIGIIVLLLLVGCATVEGGPCVVEWKLKSGLTFVVTALCPPRDIDGIWHIKAVDGMYITVPDIAIATMTWHKEITND